MQTLKLAAPFVAFANALYHREATEPSGLALLEYLDELENDLLVQHSDHFLSSLDASRFSNILYLIGCVRSMVTGQALSNWSERDVVGLGFELTGEIEIFLEERNKSLFVAMLPLDKVIVTGLAVLQGRGDWAAVAKRLPLAQTAVAHWSQKVGQNYPPDVLEALRLGFTHVESGFEELREALPLQDPELLQSALSLLKQGGELISVLVDWDLQRQLRRGQHVLPAGGPELEALADMAREGHKDWEQACRYYRRHLFPQLCRRWSEVRELLLLPLRHHADALGRTDEALLVLKEALEAPELSVEALVQAQGEVLDCFQFLQSHRLRVQRGLSNEHEVGLELVATAWEGGIPDVVLREVQGKLAAPGQPRAIKRALHLLREYFRTRERLLLLEVAEQMIKALDELQTPEWVLRGARCQCCDQGYDAGQGGAEFGCHHVGGAHSFLDLVA